MCGPGRSGTAATRGMVTRDAFPLRAPGQRCAAAGRTVREERVLWLLAVRTMEPIGRAANPRKGSGSSGWVQKKRQSRAGRGGVRAGFMNQSAADEDD